MPTTMPTRFMGRGPCLDVDGAATLRACIVAGGRMVERLTIERVHRLAANLFERRGELHRLPRLQVESHR